ncbi:hypothetical protein D1631_18510 [Chryseobacterium nematophagum]|uniref:Uncharacterized protein n=1 Tax=Chryseobacterium nematophagum TaxID=2305228 RepID=A0A3M7TB59_9FLAO|nr:FISUMP domain-containing protein [Chryseobacterium nematophagum]RNA60485.1 hypothetical protein D1631_18510 [Chryseobacterium nematophagum]
MKKTNLLLCALFGVLAYGQVGVNTTSPKATFDVTSKTTDGSSPEGIMAPRLAGSILHTADTNGTYGQSQDGALVFVTAPPVTAERVGQTVDIIGRGYYYYDFPANKWVRASIGSNQGSGTISHLECNNATFSPPTIAVGQAYTGVLTVPYTGGNGATYPQDIIDSNGLHFVLPAGTLVNGNGNLEYIVTGTPLLTGNMLITLNIAEASCSFNKVVTDGNTDPGSLVMCGSSQRWALYNVGVEDTSLDPNTPSKDLQGKYYQWGRKDPVADVDTDPAGIPGWNTVPAANNAWNTNTNNDPVKSALDPCPPGYRVPTTKEWMNLIGSTSHFTIGAFTDDPANFGAGIRLTCANNGNTIMLPAAGTRRGGDGALIRRGNIGKYWSSGAAGDGSTTSLQAYNLYFTQQGAFDNYNNLDARDAGNSVRCISE